MNQPPSHASRSPDDVEARQQLRLKLERLANGLDTAFRIPGTSIRFGADALVGLIPGIGDVFGLGMGLWLLWQARSVRAPGRLQARMIGNLAFETVLGAVPLLGDAFDVLWQANQRNRKILTDWMDEQDAQTAKRAGRSGWLWVLLALAILGASGALLL